MLKDNVEEKSVKPPRVPVAKKEKPVPKSAKEGSSTSEASKAKTKTKAQGKGKGKDQDQDQDQAQVQATVTAEAVTLPADWASHGTITLVSPATLSGFAVIQTEVATGTQLQPVLTADGAVAVPLSIPISVSHTGGGGDGGDSGTTTTTSTTTTTTPLPITVPVTEAILAPVQKQGEKQARRKPTALATVEVMSPTLEAAMVAGEIQCVTVGETDLEGEADNTDSGFDAQTSETTSAVEVTVVTE